MDAPAALDFEHPMIKATASVTAAAFRKATGRAAPPPQDGIEKCAAAAFEVAKAKVSGDREALIRAQAELAKFGTCDPRWTECITEFAWHYAFTKHSDVPYRRWASFDDFVITNQPGQRPALPDQCRIAIFGDWGTGEDRAQQLLRKIAAAQPDILLHLGDIYYSCNANESHDFHERCCLAFPNGLPPLYTLCGNHDMYSGAAPYYALLTKLGQPASFFCLRNDHWQFQAMDTGYNDFDPLQVNTEATWVQDFDDRDNPYSELAWHADKLRTAGNRKVMLLSHHQPFSRNSAITGKFAVNQRLCEQFRPYFPRISAWLFGHEHNQVIYAPFLGLNRARCIGASAIPVDKTESLYTPDQHFLNADGTFNQPVPDLLSADPALCLEVDSELDLYNLGYAMMTLDGAKGAIDYYQYNSSTDTSSLMFHEEY